MACRRSLFQRKHPAVRCGHTASLPALPTLRMRERPSSLRVCGADGRRWWRSGRWALDGERAWEVLARVDPELAVDAAELILDGLRGYEQRLCDVAVRRSVGSHLRHAHLTRGQRVASADHLPPWPGAGGSQLLVGARGEPFGAAPARDIKADAQRVAGGGALVGATQRGAKLDQCAGALERRPRAL